MNSNRRNNGMALILMMSIAITVSPMLRADTGTCGGQMITLPFTDVPASNIFFCAIGEAYFSGLTNGTMPTTYSPSANVPREQMAAFVTRTMDQSLKRSSQRAALRQFWTTQEANNLGLTTVGDIPYYVESDGADLWVTNRAGSSVSRVHASDGKLLGTWTGATNASAVLIAMGKVFVTGASNPGRLFQIDPTGPPGAVTTLTSALGTNPEGIAYDGEHIWIANGGTGPGTGSVSRVSLNPLLVTTVTTGFSSVFGILYDGANIWVTDSGDAKIKKLDSNGMILQSVSIGSCGGIPSFDGTNIWVPQSCLNAVRVIRAGGSSAGTVLAVLSGNGLNQPHQAAFDGERILVTNEFGDSVSLWKASDLTPIGTFPTGDLTAPTGVCSDGLNFWITLRDVDKLARF
jgi:hypothetical protein